ncbi:MAG: hypothetical protein CMM50_05370 [Rhodospirillaceae bacterium]|nr:hypothetical protein [Rhodospirillaceae bacterium]|tara:strand:+ start:693 stop:1883 length:1191 start_codon:yes stop_codon:yes gene_type:complete
MVFLRPSLIAALILLSGTWPAWAFNNVTTDFGTPVVLLDDEPETRHAVMVALGELAFKSRETLGVSVFSCDTCHPDGHASRKFFFPGLSDKPGNIDVTNQILTHIEDGFFNPLNIPSLIGIAHTPPYGRDGRFPEIADFTLFAIINEFAGLPPSDLALEALVAFQESLAFPDNPLLDGKGGLTPAATDEARRGEALFHEARGEGGLSCASCHVPETYFRDGAIHDVGSGRASKAGKEFETPTLLATTESAPYFHDGRFDTFGEVVDYFDDYYGLGFTEMERADLVAYLDAVGGGTTPYPQPKDEVHPETAAKLLEATLGGDDYLLTDIVIEKVTAELFDYRRSGMGPPPETVTAWIAALRKIEPAAAKGDFDAARAALAEFRRLVAAAENPPPATQ